MSRIKFDADLIRSISYIQKIIRVPVKDCLEYGNRYLILVPENEISKAIGRGGDNVRKIEKALNRKIKIVEFNPNALQFIKNLVHPLQITDGSVDDGVITLIPSDVKSRGYLIGRNAATLRQTEDIVKRYFPIKEIKIGRSQE